jgi:peptide deformylase
MQDTMRTLNGAGLAAPQIGVGLQIVISVSMSIRAIRKQSRCPTPY